MVASTRSGATTPRLRSSLGSTPTIRKPTPGLLSLPCSSPACLQQLHRAPMNSRRAVAGAATGPDGRIYVMGGNNGSRTGDGTVGTAEVYDPAADTWTPIAPMLTDRSTPGSAAGPDGRIYAVGGFTHGGV